VSRGYRAFASACALALAAGGLAYSISFVLIAKANAGLGLGLSDLFLMVGGLLTPVVAVALYQLLKETDASIALLALLFSVAAGTGSAIHGAHELAIVAHPAVNPAADLPNPVDPRGFLTFGVAGLGVLLFSWLVLRGGGLSPRVGYLGYLSGALLIIIFLARMIIFQPSSPLLLIPAGLEGFIVNPLWYVLIGLSLRRAL
jgi:hypothetical protein